MAKKLTNLDYGTIKVCIDPQCDTVFINAPSKPAKCLDCGLTIKMINKQTFLKKYVSGFFSFCYDYKTGDLIRDNLAHYGN